MFDLQLSVFVELYLGVLDLALDLLFGFLFPEPFGGRGRLQHLVAAGTADAATAVPERFRVVEFVFEARVSLGDEHRLSRFRRHRDGVDGVLAIREKNEKRLVVSTTGMRKKGEKTAQLNGFFFLLFSREDLPTFSGRKLCSAVDVVGRDGLLTKNRF